MKDMFLSRQAKCKAMQIKACNYSRNMFHIFKASSSFQNTTNKTLSITIGPASRVKHLQLCPLCLRYFHLCPANSEKCSVRGGRGRGGVKKKMQISHWKLDLCSPEKHPENMWWAPHSCKRRGWEGERRKWEWRWVWTIAAVRVFEETANDPRRDMESEGLVTVGNPQT